jgi:hypothetical protein
MISRGWPTSSGASGSRFSGVVATTKPSSDTTPR